MINLPESVQQWLLHLQKQGKSEHTVQAYRRGLEHYLTWNKNLFGAEFQPATIIPRDIRDWMSYQRQVERAAPSTVNQRLVALSRFFAWAAGQGWISVNPTADISHIKLGTRKPTALSTKQVRRLLRTVHSGGRWRDIALIEVMLGTGIRVGELLDLKVGDITLRDRSGVLVVREGKHGSYREIPLTYEARTALSRYLDQHPYQDEPQQALWFSGHGPLRHRSAVLRILNRYAERAGLGLTVSSHQMRHTFATNYLNANPDDVRGLAALLGHSSLDTVMIYTQPTLEDLVGRMERFEMTVQYHEEGDGNGSPDY